MPYVLIEAAGYLGNGRGCCAADVGLGFLLALRFHKESAKR